MISWAHTPVAVVGELESDFRAMALMRRVFTAPQRLAEAFHDGFESLSDGPAFVGTGDSVRSKTSVSSTHSLVSTARKYRAFNWRISSQATRHSTIPSSSSNGMAYSHLPFEAAVVAEDAGHGINRVPDG